MSDDQASKDGLRWEIRQRLVERLRIPWEGMGEMANQQRQEAAVQISTMMDEIEAWRNSARKADRDIAELRAERDDARREVCESDTETHGGALLEAERRGWDCFKEQP